MKTVIEMAREAGWEYADDDRGFEPLWRFAELVRADEREDCAKVCEREWNEYCAEPSGYALAVKECSSAIRARGNT